MVKIIPNILILCFAVSTARAGDISGINHNTSSSSQESTGVLTGAILGGAVGGPPGVVVGASVGAIIGNTWQAREQVINLRTSLSETQLELLATKEKLDLVEKENEISKAKLALYSNTEPQILTALQSTNLNKTCCDNTVFSIHFKTGSSDIESYYEEHLRSVSEIAKEIPGTKIEITGFADRNGDAAGNLSLSRRRSEEVRGFFAASGINDTSIITAAYGDTRPLQPTQSLESDFFDRRVTVRLRVNNRTLLSQMPDPK